VFPPPPNKKGGPFAPPIRFSDLVRKKLAYLFSDLAYSIMFTRESKLSIQAYNKRETVVKFFGQILDW